MWAKQVLILSVFSCLQVTCLQVKSQLISARLNINGITCISCLNSTQNALLAHDFIDSVSIDGHKGIAFVFFSEGKKVSLNKIANTIYKAGFSLNYTSIVYQFNNANTEKAVEYFSDKLIFLNTKNQILNGPISISIIGKKFTSHSEYKKWQKEIKAISKNNQVENGDLYFILYE